MAIKTFNDGPVRQGAGLTANYSNAREPFIKNGGMYSRKFAITTDYTSGDDIVIKLHNIQSIEFAVGVSQVGAIKALADAALSTPESGRSITLSNVTTDALLVYIIYKT